MSGLRLSVLTGVAGLFALSGCMGDPLPKQSPDFPIASYPKWRAEDATYRFYPGDKFRVDVRTAPELSGEFTVAPDGRIALPTIGAIMAGGQLFGFFGMLLALPVAAILVVLLRHAHQRYINSHWYHGGEPPLV